jgi:hypothetical protein
MVETRHPDLIVLFVVEGVLGRHLAKLLSPPRRSRDGFASARSHARLRRQEGGPQAACDVTVDSGSVKQSSKTKIRTLPPE